MSEPSRQYLLVKRILDVTLAAGILGVTLPLCLGAAAWIRLEGGGPVLYRGLRVGRHGRPFKMLKFRSMVANASSIGGPSTADGDPRVTRAGRFLRRWKIDELPQVVNVLRGDMSLVGPRPQVAEDVARYTAAERELLRVQPGITDWASIRFRNEGMILAGHLDPDLAYDQLVRPHKLALGLRYAADPSLAADLQILWWTARALIQPATVDAVLAHRLSEPAGSAFDVGRSQRRAHAVPGAREGGK